VGATRMRVLNEAEAAASAGITDGIMWSVATATWSVRILVSEQLAHAGRPSIPTPLAPLWPLVSGAALVTGPAAAGPGPFLQYPQQPFVAQRDVAGDGLADIPADAVGCSSPGAP